MKHHLIEKGVKLILKGLEVDTTDENYDETPERFARAMEEMFSPKVTEWATFKETHSDLILLRSHKIWTLCPHHLFPVEFSVSLAYIPNGHVLGLSKLARVLHEVNSKPYLQEAFTHDVADKVYEILPTNKGVACFVRGSHGCMQIRGVKTEADVVTYKLTGVFDKDPMMEQRFFQLIERRQK